MKSLALAGAAVGFAYLSLKYNAEVYGFACFFCTLALLDR